ncbi:DUF4334 domain-containing protein [Rhizobium sp. SSA_523]|uniref:DUF4334 domain-containing protein n=1 Tax=Rhizobium sp. SSA_523 TaxID=2952477 RepID=UPI0020908327|nr:DUF4334 domain-containing protein [Rhizobium sp. SSA_523]MCO5730873.1 DUF4334 domain-containing protein [Rhizobium sp. SSA_523]WKC24310.1 DUF4334 domain-containing protein [Rhizobium sp. SSA_523]
MSDLTSFDDETAAFAVFDSLPPLLPSQVTGLWQGRSLPSHHPLDGVLENLGWYGKRFHADRRADALLFRWGEDRLVPVDPARIPLVLALHAPRFGRSRAAQNLFSHLVRRLRAYGPVASLRLERYRGVQSLAMVYDRKPITDHFRRLDEDRIMGAMAVEGEARTFFFELERTG